MLPDKGNGEMDARSRVRRILWGTLRGTLPAARALTMMVRWEADFAPTFERDPAATMTGFLQQELGASLQRAECALLADRILTIMDEFSGTLPQDPIASMRRLSEQRLGVEPGAVAPGAAPVDTAPRAEPVVDAGHEVARHEVVGHEVAEPDLAAQAVLDDGAVLDDEASLPIIDDPVNEWVERMPDASSAAPMAIDALAPGHGSVLESALESTIESAILPDRRYYDADPVEPPRAAHDQPTERAGLPPFSGETLFDDDRDVDQDVEHLRAPRGFERARTLEILAPINTTETDQLDPVEFEAEPEAPLATTIPPLPPAVPVQTAADPSARYGIDRSVFSKIFLEHD